MEQDMEAMAGGDGVSVHTGFPNPALDRRGASPGQLALDLNQLLIKHPSSTYLFRISGHQWTDQGVYDGDIAVIDRAVMPHSGRLLIIWQDAGFKLRRYQRGDQLPEGSWGVVTATIHQLEGEY